MYQHVFHYFGLPENPFCVSPDPRFYFSTPAHDAALAELIHGVEQQKGFLVLTGEAGTGKTTLMNHFLNWLRKRQLSSSYVFHPRLKSVQLFDCILRDFGVTCESQTKGDLLAALSHWLIRRHAVGDSPVVIIDEAQAISVRTLDRLRLLLNLETAGSKLLQIVLAGQPELEEKLRRPELRHLHQRVTIHTTLPPFSLEETSQYVKSRLARAGATDANIFAQASLEALHGYARGIPRIVNLLCEHALIAGYGKQATVISPDMIRRVAADFDLTPHLTATMEPEISTRFARLVPFRPEEKLPRVAPERVTVESNKAEKMIAGPAAPGARQWKPTPLPEVVPIFIVNEAKDLETPAANRVIAPETAPAPSVHYVVRTIAKQAEAPQPVPNKKLLVVGWRTLNLGERFVCFWQEMNAYSVRDWKWVKDKLAARRPANEPATAAAPNVHHAVRTIKNQLVDSQHVLSKKLLVGWRALNLGERFVRFWQEMNTYSARNWKWVKDKLAARRPANEPSTAAAPNVHHAVRTIKNQLVDSQHVLNKKLLVGWRALNLGERFVRFWQGMNAYFARNWKWAKDNLAARRPANKPTTVSSVHYVLQTITNQLVDSQHVLSKKLLVGWRALNLGERFVRYWNEVRGSLWRDWKRFMDGPVAANPMIAPVAASSVHHAVRTIAKGAEDPEPGLSKKLLVGWKAHMLVGQFVLSGEAMKAFFVRGWNSIRDKHAPRSLGNEPTVAAVPSVQRKVRTIAKPARDPEQVPSKKLQFDRPRTSHAERFVRYWREVGASFARDCKQFMGANRPAWDGARRRR